MTMTERCICPNCGQSHQEKRLTLPVKRCMGWVNAGEPNFFPCRFRARPDRDFCARHEPEQIAKQRLGGCCAATRHGACRGIPVADGLCGWHWARRYGHQYYDKERSFMGTCALCAAAMPGWGTPLPRVPIYRQGACPSKL